MGRGGPGERANGRPSERANRWASWQEGRRQTPCAAASAPPPFVYLFSPFSPPAAAVQGALVLAGLCKQIEKSRHFTGQLAVKQSFLPSCRPTWQCTRRLCPDAARLGSTERNAFSPCRSLPKENRTEPVSYSFFPPPPLCLCFLFSLPRDDGRLNLCQNSHFVCRLIGHQPLPLFCNPFRWLMKRARDTRCRSHKLSSRGMPQVAATTGARSSRAQISMAAAAVAAVVVFQQIVSVDVPLQQELVWLAPASRATFSFRNAGASSMLRPRARDWGDHISSSNLRAPHLPRNRPSDCANVNEISAFFARDCFLGTRQRV